MSLLKSMISEMAVPGSTGANAFASNAGPLFKGGYIDPTKSKKKKKGIHMHRVEPISMPRLAEAMGISSDETKFNAADVISKLDAAEKKANANQDTTAFGLKDEDGNIVQVYVRQDQAADFEKALGALLSGQNEGDDDNNSALEIAEVLFELRNKFDIVDVDWGTIPADEEEEQEVQGNPEGGEVNPDELAGEEGMMDPNAMPGQEDADVKSALSQVIDLLKSQAEAQKAEADARAAEAKAREAEAAAKAAESKIKQEEETLDMEAYYKKKADEKKEAQRLAKLAKFKHDTAKEAESLLQQDGGAPSVDVEQTTDVQMQGVEQEERVVVSPRELAAAIFRQLQSK